MVSNTLGSREVVACESMYNGFICGSADADRVLNECLIGVLTIFHDVLNMLL